MNFEFCYVCTTWCKLGIIFFCDIAKPWSTTSTSHIHFRNSSVGYLIKMVLAQMVLAQMVIAQTRSSRVVLVEKGPKWHFQDI